MYTREGASLISSLKNSHFILHGVGGLIEAAMMKSHDKPNTTHFISVTMLWDIS